MYTDFNHLFIITTRNIYDYKGHKRKIMPPAFKESLTLNLAQSQKSFNVIHFGGNSNIRSIFNRFGDIAGYMRPEPTV